MTLSEVRHLSIVQFDTYSLVYQINKLEEEHTFIQSVGLGVNGKNIKSILNGVLRRIEMLRRGSVNEEDVVEAQLDGLLGESVGPITDNGLSALGITVGVAPESK